MQRSFASVIVIPLVLLAACSSAPVVGPADTGVREAEAVAAFERGDYLAARESFTALARQAEGIERQRYLIERARSELALGNPELALATLDSLLLPLPDALNASQTAVRADALFALGRTVEAVELLVEREIWLDSSAAILENQARIWAGLAHPSSRGADFGRTGDPTVDGWLALAPLILMADDGDRFLPALINWQQEFGNHPAAAGILAERVAELRGDGTLPGQVALLLPLGSGEAGLRLPARAVQEGFFAAHYASGGLGTTAIRVYDTARFGTIESYRQAQLDGADFIVGPLDQRAVSEVMPEAGFVPTLALNVAAEPALPATNFFQFALSSDDEIEAIAARAIAAGRETAVILYEASPRGRSFWQRFEAAFASRGGTVLDVREYGADLATPIQALLNITASERRAVQLENTLGLNVEFEPRRRTDIDMIFLYAEPAAGRLVVPLLEQNDAAGIPVYATRDIYDPTRRGGDPDLEGVIFPDVPLLIDPVGEARVAAGLLEDYRSEAATRQERLFAFGFDAYHLVRSLYAGSTGSWPLEGATGELFVGQNGRIRRMLPLAEFTDGLPRSLGTGTGLLSAR